jgi:hypothetical protein
MLPLAPLTPLIDAVLSAVRDALPADAAGAIIAAYHHNAAAMGAFGSPSRGHM